ncbi:DUF6576 domain-containing protein [Chryseobacterium defluvii]|uniref:DUF6576 domain-containing protein n=1 Tax=Chryseobacterium defluvii TaxID=160396 RepID=A0A495SAI8_9FLAO|nr:DUF6576 domain-containing protein [Chryseobacterium defluvii]RKS96852.1 hypothetical protein BCF58_3287 [Chryseobacterium defluvii]
MISLIPTGAEREKEIDQLLGKMGKNGINDLSAKDRKRLDELSKK